jgi:branched-chain amino acid transport system permease protein
VGVTGWFLAGAAALCVLVPLVLEQYKLYILSLTLVYLILAIGLKLTPGYAGQISLCHAAFMSFGADRRAGAASARARARRSST